MRVSALHNDEVTYLLVHSESNTRRGLDLDAGERRAKTINAGEKKGSRENVSGARVRALRGGDAGDLPIYR